MRISKMKNLLLAMMAAGVLTGMYACHSDEAEPEIIVDPVETQVEYYIIGKVADQEGAALANVEVKTDGASTKTDAEGKYKLTVKEKKNYTLTFTLEGYENMNQNNQVMMPSDLANRSTVVMNISLSKKGEKVNLSDKVEEAAQNNEVVVITEKGAETQKKDEDTEASEGTKEEVEATVAVTVAPEAIENKEGESNNISVTPYVPENENKAEEDKNHNESAPAKKVEAAVVNVNITSDKDIILQAPASIQVQAKVEKKEEAFETVKVYREVTARATDWEYVCDAIYNAANNSYVMKLEKGAKLNGNYSFRIEPVLKSVKNGSKVIKEDKIDNAGNYDAIEYTINYEAPMGWKAEFMSNVAANTQKQILKAISSKESGAEGISTEPYTFKGKLSGNHILYYTAKSKFVEKMYSMKLKGGEANVRVTAYKGTDFKFKSENADKHSGGGLN